MGSALNYWNVPNVAIVALGNSGSGTNNVSTDGLGTNAKQLLAAEASGTYGTRIFSITVNGNSTVGSDALLLFDGSGSTAPVWHKVAFVNQAFIVFDDGELDLPGAIHLPKFLVPSGAYVFGADINNNCNLWVHTQGGDGG